MGVSGNRNIDGDWALVVKVNNLPLFGKKIISGKAGWQDLSFDLSRYAGRTVTMDVEIYANNWLYEYAFIDYIEITGSGTAATPPPPPPPTQPSSDVISTIVSEKGLIAYYPFNGNTADESGHNRHAKVYGAKLTRDRFGNANSAYHFDGKDDYIQAPVNINPAKLPRCTIVAWARVDKRPQRVQVVSHDNAGYDRSLGIDNRGGGMGWSAFCGSGGVLGFKPVALNQWTFVAVSYDQAKGIIKLYVDGKKFEKKGILKSGKNAIRIGSNPSFAFTIGYSPPRN